MANAQDALVLAEGHAPDWAFHLADGLWTHSPLLWAWLAAGLLAVALVWLLTAGWRPVWRSLLRSGLIAALFSPAIVACESISIMPFPILLKLALQNREALSCGAPLVALPPNAMTFGGLWLVLFLAFWVWQWFRQPPAAGR